MKNICLLSAVAFLIAVLVAPCAAEAGRVDHVFPPDSGDRDFVFSVTSDSFRERTQEHVPVRVSFGNEFTLEPHTIRLSRVFEPVAAFFTLYLYDRLGRPLASPRVKLTPEQMESLRTRSSWPSLELRNGEHFRTTIDVAPLLPPNLPEGTYHVKLTYNNTYGPPCFNGSRTPEDGAMIEIIHPAVELEGSITEQRALELAASAAARGGIKPEGRITVRNNARYFVVTYWSKPRDGFDTAGFQCHITIDRMQGIVKQVLFDSCGGATLSPPVRGNPDPVTPRSTAVQVAGLRLSVPDSPFEYVARHRQSVTLPVTLENVGNDIIRLPGRLTAWDFGLSLRDKRLTPVPLPRATLVRAGSDSSGTSSLWLRPGESFTTPINLSALIPGSVPEGRYRIGLSLVSGGRAPTSNETWITIYDPWVQEVVGSIAETSAVKRSRAALIAAGYALKPSWSIRPTPSRFVVSLTGSRSLGALQNEPHEVQTFVNRRTGVVEKLQDGPY